MKIFAYLDYISQIFNFRHKQLTGRKGYSSSFFFTSTDTSNFYYRCLRIYLLHPLLTHKSDQIVQ